MPYNSETETFYQSPATVVDSTPDGDTVQEGFDDRLTPAMAGLYADLNLLKADGMISVGIPATTTARGIGRVATSADLVDGATITNGPAFLAAGVHTSVAAAAGKVPVADADGSLNSWAGARYAACSTAAATAAKAADLANFKLVNGSRVFVTFANANTVAGALTLNVNGTGAKPVYNERGVTSSSNIATWLTGVPIEFVYDGTNWRYKTSDATGNAIGFYFYARDEKSPGTAGGSSSSATWHTRDLNTVVKTADWATLASNKITLSPGRYYVRATAPGYATGGVRVALYNVTAGAYLDKGRTEYGGTSYSSDMHNGYEGEIIISVQSQIELRMYVASGLVTNGLGTPSNVTGTNEIYSEMRIWKM